MHLWRDMFVLEPAVAEKVLRRLWSTLPGTLPCDWLENGSSRSSIHSDLVVLLTLSNTVQNAIIRRRQQRHGRRDRASTLLLVNYLVVKYLYRHEKLSAS